MSYILNSESDHPNASDIPFRQCLQYAAVLNLFLWIVKVYEPYLPWLPDDLAIKPREWSSIVRILTFPFVHKDYAHLAGNTGTLMVMMPLVQYLWSRIYRQILLGIYIAGGALLWIVGRPLYHIGSSGIVYGLVTFCFFSGLFRRDKRTIALALLITFLYGSLVWGILPFRFNQHISWEGHLCSSIVGALLAWIFRSEPIRGEAEIEQAEEPENIYLMEDYRSQWKDDSTSSHEKESSDS